MGNTRNVRDIVEQLKIADRAQFDELVSEYGGDPRAGVQRAIKSARKRLDARDAEIVRVEEMYSVMREAGDDAIVAGVDEVGRGSIAGPLTVAAVVLPNKPIIEGLNDSKKLSAERREELAREIGTRALGVGIAHIQPQEIDSDGISLCLRRAMVSALEALDMELDLVLIDGNPVHVHPAERCIVKGDSKVACISAASIVAKVTRDELMRRADSKYPGYGFADNKGYGSEAHIEAIKRLGLSDFHRKTFCTSFLQESLF